MAKRAAPIRAEDVDAIYYAYPRRVEPETAKREIRRALAAPEVTARARAEGQTAFDWLLARVKLFARACRAAYRDDKKYIVYPERWFKRKRYLENEDEWLTAEARQQRRARQCDERERVQAKAVLARRQEEANKRAAQSRRVLDWVQSLPADELEARRRLALRGANDFMRRLWQNADPTKNQLLAMAMYKARDEDPKAKHEDDQQKQ